MERKIVDYQIVTGCDSEYDDSFVDAHQELQDSVGTYLAEGWQPYGFPHEDKAGILWQAMVKYAD